MSSPSCTQPRPMSCLKEVESRWKMQKSTLRDWKVALWWSTVCNVAHTQRQRTIVLGIRDFASKHYGYGWCSISFCFYAVYWSWVSSVLWTAYMLYLWTTGDRLRLAAYVRRRIRQRNCDLDLRDLAAFIDGRSWWSTVSASTHQPQTRFRFVAS